MRQTAGYCCAGCLKIQPHLGGFCKSQLCPLAGPQSSAVISWLKERLQEGVPLELQKQCTTFGHQSWHALGALLDRVRKKACMRTMITLFPSAFPLHMTLSWLQ